MTVNWTEVHADLNDISCKIIQFVNDEIIQFVNDEEIQTSVK